MSTNPPAVSSQVPSRRSFLVALGSTILGSFFLPALPAAAKSAAGEGAAAAELATDRSIAQRVRRLLLPPVWSKERKVLVWMEVIEGREQPVVMSWTPETEHEQDEAARFYEAATWRSWRTLEDLHAILRKPGPWLIRLNITEKYAYPSTADPKALFGPESNSTLLYDPQTAVRLTSEQALELIPRLMDRWGYDRRPDGAMYLEPVKPEDARTNFRALRYPAT
jgi:hypothetical protein